MLRALLQALARLLGAFFSPPGTQATPSVSKEPKWLALARREIGWHEIGENRGIERYIKLGKCGAPGDPWCAIFVNAMLQAAGVAGSRSALARSFETNPNFVELNGPALGAIVTMWRGSRGSGSGHVFFYTGDARSGVVGIAGNEDDAVREAIHASSRITGYWWPKLAPAPTHIGPVLRAGATTAFKEV